MHWTSILSVASVTLLSTLVHCVPTYTAQSDGYYNYVEKAAGGHEAGLKAAVQTFYTQMVAEHSHYPDYPEPMMAAGMVINNEYYFATSGSYKKGPKLSGKYPSNFPAVLKTALDQCYEEYGEHKKQSNCAEIRLIAYYFEQTHAVGFPAQIPLAVFGKGGVSQSVQFHHPCTGTPGLSGCGNVVTHTFSMDALTRRTLEAGKEKRSGRSHSRDVNVVLEN